MAAALPGLLDFAALKDGFTKLVNQAEPNCLPAFILWLDLKVAQFKINGCMYADTLHEETWITYAKEVLKKINNGRGNHNVHPSLVGYPYPAVTDGHNVSLTNSTPIPAERYPAATMAGNYYPSNTDSDSNSCVPLSLVKKKKSSRSSSDHKTSTTTNSGIPISNGFIGSNSLISEASGSQPLISASSLSSGSRYKPSTDSIIGAVGLAPIALLSNSFEPKAHESSTTSNRSHTNSTSSAASSYTESLVTDGPLNMKAEEPPCSSYGTDKPFKKRHTTLRSLLSEPPKGDLPPADDPTNNISQDQPVEMANLNGYPHSVEVNGYPSTLPAPVGDRINGEDSPSHNAYDIQKPNTKEALKIVLTKKSKQRRNKDKALKVEEQVDSGPTNGLDLSYSTWGVPTQSDAENSPSKSSVSKERIGSPKGHNVCPICYRKFDYRSSFRRHMRIHEGVYSHQCAICGRKFTRKEHFDRHKCSRRPNKPSRSADGNESSPEKRIKVAYPPAACFEGASNGGHSTDDHDNSFDNEHMLTDSLYFDKGCPASSLPKKSLLVAEEVDSMDETRSNGGGESRRKKSKPRRALEVQPEEEDVEAFYRNNTPKSSPNDLSDVDSTASPLHDHEDKPMDLSEPAQVSSPIPSDHSDNGSKADVPDRLREYIEMSPGYSTEDDTYSDPGTPTPGTDTEFTLDTGNYKVSEEDMLKLEGCGEFETNSHGKFIKVTKQGKYLKLKNEVQVIDGHLCFVCPNCGKVFHRSSNFSRHMRIHRGVYSYLCPTCHRGFFRKEHFQKHKCHRKSMSHIWERKTKLDMVLKPKNGDLDVTEEAPLSQKLPPGDCIDQGMDEENEDGSGRLYIDENPTPDREATPTEI